MKESTRTVIAMLPFIILSVGFTYSILELRELNEERREKSSTFKKEMEMIKHEYESEKLVLNK